MTDISSKQSKSRRRWFQFSLRTLLIVVTLAAGLLVVWRIYNRAETEPAMPIDELVKSLSSVSLETEADVRRVVSNAAACERAIMFLHVDWAFMEPQRTRYAQFAIDYRRAYPNDDLRFHYVDCTQSYAPLRALTGWAELEGAAGGSLIQGWGELVWMERGRVLHVERILDFESTSRLLEKTEALMPTQCAPAAKLGVFCLDNLSSPPSDCDRFSADWPSRGSRSQIRW